MKQIIISLTGLFIFSASFAQQGAVTISQDDGITKLLEYKKDPETNEFYKIQVYQSVDPDFAKSQRSRFLNNYGEWPVEIQWQTPNYKVWVGNFSSRLQADRAWLKIRKKYANATVLKPKIDRKRKR